MAQCIAFHSYKGGTGKTTIASNLAARLASNGNKVALLDFDVYAPSLHAYFEFAPERWVNDFLFDLASIKEVLYDMSSVLSSTATQGKLWVGFSNPKKEDIYKLDGSEKHGNSRLQLLRKFIRMREEIISNYDVDYIIIDTSPGIRYWSINSLALADVLLLTLKFDDLDIDGTKKIAKDIYGSFLEFGAKSYLLLNRVAGYCVPTDGNMAKLSGFVQQDKEVYDMLSRETGMEVITTIPCYCDIQFSRKEYLTVLKSSDHPFAKQIEKLAMSAQIKV
ncbi:MinD/ParA family ATP-binding protein [Candidatus Nitrososphaera sp. FF02]|uniref:MinD/ParA family ATP-binding protein n=1 Tax=Candidatus Nitrososphaera sp. FF02 TaxID=3398226 RepID=UPI0039EB9C8A